MKFNIFVTILMYITCFSFPLQSAVCHSRNGDGDFSEWYAKRSNNSDEIYGIGHGSTMQSAQSAALSDIASQLRVTISSKMQTKMSDSSKIGFEKHFSYLVEAKVKDVTFNHYNVVDVMHLANGNVAVLASIKKSLFLQEKLQEMNDLINIMKNSYVRINDTSSILQKYKALAHINNIALKVREINYLTASLDDRKSTLDRAHIILFYRKAFEDALNTMYVRLVCNDEKVNDVFIAAINNAGLNLATKAISDSDPNLVIINVKVDYLEKVIYSMYTVKMNVGIKLKDSAGNLALTNNITIHDASIISPTAARDAAALSLKKHILLVGLAKSFGLKELNDSGANAVSDGR